MRSINKFRSICLIWLSSALVLSGCGNKELLMPYTPDNPVSSYRIDQVEELALTATPFASELCVTAGNMSDGTDVDMTQANAAGLFSVDTAQTLYAKNVHDKLAPASLTKVLTALVALKHGSPDDILTASENVKITESGAQTCGIKAGDKMTLEQALHVMLINSANDAAVMIAEGIGGSIEGFSEMMNEEAKAIGATNSHFVNPHGLSNDEHYTTAYDMYLIFNEAMKLETFTQIIQMSTYETVYQDKNGQSKELKVNNTNQFLTTDVTAPENVTVLGGKTGTTNAAGHCLILLSKDSGGKYYISIVLKSAGRDILYSEMTDLLEEIKN